MNELYNMFVVRPRRIDLSEVLIRNKAAPAGELARMLDELLDAEAGDLRAEQPPWEQEEGE